MTHPPGTIAIPCGELARFALPLHSFANMVYPPGSRVEIVQSLSIPRNLNEIIRNMTGEWVWFQSDDHVLAQPDALISLLDRDLDVVVPLMVRRRPPFSPVVFKERDERGWYVPFAYDELPASGLLEVPAGAGTGGMLVRKHVLDAIGDPWFEFDKGEFIKEDVDFTA